MECIVCYEPTAHWSCATCPATLCFFCRARVETCPMCRHDIGAAAGAAAGAGADADAAAAADAASEADAASGAAPGIDTPDDLVFETARIVLAELGLDMDQAVWTLLVDHVQFLASEPAESMTSLLTLWQRAGVDFLGLYLSVPTVFGMVVSLRSVTDEKPDWLQWRFVDEHWSLLEAM